MKKLIILSLLLLTFQSSNVYGQTGPWGPRVQPSPSFPRGRPMSPWGQAARIAREQAWRYVQEQKRQIEAGWEQHRVEGERYGNALRREQEAHRQAEYAERYFPNTAVSRSYRQAANEASMNRARAEITYMNRTQETMRRWGISSTPPDWMRSGQWTTERRGSPQSRKGDLPFSRQFDNRRNPSDRVERTISGYGYGPRVTGKIQDRLSTSDNDRGSPQSRKGDLPFSRQSDNRRDPSDRVERTISGYGYGPRVTDKIQDRLPATSDNDRGGRTGRSSDSGSTRSSGDGDKKDWRDAQRERADRRP